MIRKVEAWAVGVMMAAGLIVSLWGLAARLLGA